MRMQDIEVGETYLISSARDISYNFPRYATVVRKGYWEEADYTQRNRLVDPNVELDTAAREQAMALLREHDPLAFFVEYPTASTWRNRTRGPIVKHVGDKVVAERAYGVVPAREVRELRAVSELRRAAIMKSRDLAKAEAEVRFAAQSAKHGALLARFAGLGLEGYPWTPAHSGYGVPAITLNYDQVLELLDAQARAVQWALGFPVYKAEVDA